MTYTITKNPEFNSIEILFDGKPSDAVRSALKALRFRWHGVKKVWYGYADESAARQAIDAAAGNVSAGPSKKAASANQFGVKVGDIFSASWGYEQTNVNFFQVIALVGKASVRVREVYLDMIEETPTCGMAADRTYKLTKELLPATSRSCFIKDQENGDLKRIKPGFDAEPEKANEHCRFNLSSFADAHKCTGETVTTYESWYA